MFRYTKILIPIFVIAFALFANGKVVEKSKARRVAKNFLMERSPDVDVKVDFISEIDIEKNGNVMLYVFNTEKGFVMISANDVVYPVLAYSFESVFTNENVPPALGLFLDDYKTQIENSHGNDDFTQKSFSEVWEKYENGIVSKLDPKEMVNPLLLSKWSQGCYYNQQFPEEEDGPCSHLWTGCVATAMGQIMKYYNFPKQGSGSNSYYTSYGVQEADFENTTYDWAGMNYHLSESDFPVAELLYHAAISVNSILTSNGTGAYDFDARDALVDYFQYDDGATFLWRNDYEGDWGALLRSELDTRRPVLYGGVDLASQAGHTFVCDGYQDTTHFHFNWGWDGFYDGYYYIDSLIAGGNHFNFQHDAIVNIKPGIDEVIQLYPPEGLIASVTDHSVELNWEEPSFISTLELIGYNVYRNDTLINVQVVSESSFSDLLVSAGSHEYEVQSVFIGESNGPFESVEAYVSKISNNNQSAFRLFPNPVDDIICIDLRGSNINSASIIISDLTGKVLFENDCNENIGSLIEIPLDLPPALYLLEMETESGKTVQKFLVQ